MRTKSVIIIGLVVLFVIFGTSSFLQWQCALEIKHVSEYHQAMSIPAISTLDQIKLNFQEIHIASIETVESDLIIEHEEEHHSYQNGKDNFLDNLEKYNSIIFSKNSRGEFIANEMMQEKMQNYVHVYREIINSNDAVMEQYQNGEISNSNAVVLLASIEIDFHQTMKENTHMEISGMKETQSKINDIERQMEFIFIISSIAVITSSIIIVISTARFVSRPISKLIKTTKEIAKGNFISTDINSNNSDVNDISISLNQMSKDLEEYKSKIIKQEKLSTIGELASRLAHDIRNPLTVIKVTIDIIKAKNKNLTAEDIEKFERVNDAMYRITHQIDNVLDFIKGKPLKFTTQSLQKILDSTIQDLPKYEKIKIETVSTDTEIECDFEAMKIVLINLIVNAMYAIEDEGKITIRSEIKDDQVAIEIEDSGPGISDDKLEKIFEPLFTTKQEGTGLGLASCKSIIKQHGGKISVKNNPTRFIIELPRKMND